MTDSIETTVDAFHRGAFHLVQPKAGAHRAGIDAMLLAACLRQCSDMRVADFGAGAGAAGFAVASRCEHAVVTLIERDPVMADLARTSIQLPENAHLAPRLSVLEADLAHLPAKGAEQNSFDCVIMNPPFNDPADRQTPHASRSDAHVMSDGLWEIWLRKASTVLNAKGSVALIARPQSLHEILAAADRRFGALRIVPVLPRATEDAIRVLITGHKGNRKRLTICPPIILHPQKGRGFTKEVDAIINGLAVT